MALVLVIDDEPPVRDVLRRLLTLDGHDVLLAENGAVGLQLYREHEPDLVITDMTMPVKGGIETLAELKRDYPDAKVIACSGGWPDSAVDPLMIARDLGADVTIDKPFELREMREAVAGLLFGR